MNVKRILFQLGLIPLLAVGLCGCGGSREMTEMSVNTVDNGIPQLEPIDETDPPADSSEDGEQETAELIALADTLEEAERIAELYGIELSTYAYGVATYTTDKNVQELFDLGDEKGYPALSPNHKLELYTEQETN